MSRPFKAYRFIRRVDLDRSRHQIVWRNQDALFIERVARALQDFAVSADADRDPTAFHDAVAACRTNERDLLVIG